MDFLMEFMFGLLFEAPAEAVMFAFAGQLL